MGEAVRSLEEHMEQPSPRPVYDRMGTILQLLHREGINFTGEQYTPGAGVEIAYEHLNRYLLAERCCPSQAVVLDLACGSGYGSLFLSGKVRHVYAIDRSEICIATLNRVIEELEITNITPICADVEDLLNGSVELPGEVTHVVAHEFIEHIEKDLQERLVDAIAGGRAPFASNVTLFVSTPDKEVYRKGKSANPFHLHELSPEEFKTLLSSKFPNVQLFRQTNATANCILPVGASPAQLAGGHVSFLEWTDPLNLLPRVARRPANKGPYLYAIASRLSTGAPVESSFLVDTSSRSIAENLANIEQQHERAQAQLRELQKSQEVLAVRCAQLNGADEEWCESNRFYRRSLEEAENRLTLLEEELETAESALKELRAAEAALRDDYRERSVELLQTHKLVRGLEDTITAQAERISRLTALNERSGAKVVELQAALASAGEHRANQDRAIVELHGVIHQLQGQLGELSHWKNLGVSRLGPTLDQANHQLDVLRSYVDALGSPGHRLVTFVGKRLGRGFIGRSVRKVMDFFIVLRKA